MFQRVCRHFGKILPRRGLLFLLLMLACASAAAGCGMAGTAGLSAGSGFAGSTAAGTRDGKESGAKTAVPDEHGSYTSKEDVALYLHTYGHLPENYITKRDAEELGWGGGTTLDEAAPGMSIGGNRFGNREGLLPEKKGRVYYECDIDYVKGGRNAKRIVYSNDGLIFYTDDHYNSFEQLY